LKNIQSELRSLLLYNSNTYILPADTSNENNFSINLPLETCIDSALANNPIYLCKKQQSVYQQQNFYFIKKALSAPDITIGPEFDRNSNFVPNYFGLGISLPIPLLNRNQGNIKAASFQLKQQQATMQNAETVLRNNVINAYNNLLLSLQQNSSFQKSFYTGYNSMFQNMLQSYKQKQISLLEFIDFFDTYKDMQLQLFRQQLNIQLAKEALNYATGIALIK